MPRENEPIGECFHSSVEFSQTSTSVLPPYNSIETQKTCFLLFFLENSARKKIKSLMFILIIKMQILFARTFVTSAAHSSSVSEW